MDIKIAALGDFDKATQFYYDLIDGMRDDPFRPQWEKGVYPKESFILDAVNKNQFFAAFADDEIVGAMVINNDCAPGYDKIKWSVNAENGQVAVIHALGISPKLQKQGVGKKMVSYAIDYCRQKGLKSIRLDVLAKNTPPQKLYTSMGFVFMGSVRLFYEDTGVTDFRLFELDLRV